MNLRQIANSLTGTINPNRPVQWLRGTGWGQDPETGNRFPVYDTIIIPANVQAVSSSDLKLIDGIGISVMGYHRTLYINGAVLGPVRNEMATGDVFMFDNRTWKVSLIPEDWDANGWSKVIVTLQQNDGSSSGNQRCG